MQEKNFYRGNTQIEVIWHGAWNDPELRYDGKLFNYWDIENALAEDFLEENPECSFDFPNMADLNDAEQEKARKVYDMTENRFNEYVQEHGVEYCNDVIAGGYFKNDDIVVIANVNRVLEAVEDMGWSYSDISESDRYIYELSKMSDAGEDFFFTVEFDGSAENLYEAIDDFYYSFDTNEHAGELYEAGQGGLSGVPDLSTLIDDAEGIEASLSELSTACSGILFAKTIDDLSLDEQLEAARTWKTARIVESGCNVPKEQKQIQSEERG